MFLETGYVYHIKNEYFKLANDEKLMKNHENGNTRPTYFCIKNVDSKILWFIPMSSKVEKYRKLQEEKIQKKWNLRYYCNWKISKKRICLSNSKYFSNHREIHRPYRYY